MATALSSLSPLCSTCSLQKLVLEQAERIAELEKINAALSKGIAERALREHVVMRKIIGTLRNEKGTLLLV